MIDQQPASTSSTVIDVLMHGRPSVDLTFMGLPHLPRLGEEYIVSGFDINPGATFITVNAMRRLGLHVGYATDVGSDVFSRYLLEHMRAADIDERFFVFHDRDLAYISVGLSFPEDRSFITWDGGQGIKHRGVLLEDLLQNTVRCLFTHSAYPAEVFAEARRQHIPILVDAFWDREFLESDRVLASMAQADIFMPNKVEACTITRTSDPRQALAVLRDRAPMVAIKLGPDGVIGIKEGREYYVPAMPVDVVDTTGAGDNFSAGFVYGMLRDLSFEQCLRCAVAAGSLSTQQAGGIKGSPTEAELLDYVERLEHWASHTV